MITETQRAEIRRLYYAEHWRIGTIASEMGLHPSTVQAALGTVRSNPRTLMRPSRLDPYLDFIRATLEQYPRLRATRIHEMIVARGHKGSEVQTRRVVRRLRPRKEAEAFLRLSTLPGEQAQVDWGHFGHVQVGQARRPLSAFVMVLSWSRAIHVLFTLDQTMESFLRGHVEALTYFQGSARTLLYDNLKSAVLARQGNAIEFHPRLLELAGHYHFLPRPCAVARGNEKDYDSYCTSLVLCDTTFGLAFVAEMPFHLYLAGAASPGGKEAIAQEANLPLYATFLVSPGHGTGPGQEVVVAGELEQARMKLDRVALTREDGALEVVVEKGPGRALEVCKGLDVAAHEALHRLVEGEEHVQGT